MLRHLTIENSGGSDVLLLNGSSVELRDCTYDPWKTALLDGSNLTRTWTTTFYLTDAEGDSLTGALIEVVDALGDTVATDSTDAEGFSDDFALLEASEADSIITMHTPHLVHIVCPGIDTTFVYDALAEDIVELVLGDSTTISVDPPDPTFDYRLRLAQNRPNPFRKGTTIFYTLPKKGKVALEVFDIRGRLVVTLETGIQDEGDHKVSWNPEGIIADGVYFYRLETAQGVATRKMMILN